FVGYIFPEGADQRRFRLLVLKDFLHQRARWERRLTREQEIQGATQAVNVAADIDRVMVAGLLGGEVIRRADDPLGDRLDKLRARLPLGIAQAGQAPVQDFDERLRYWPGFFAGAPERFDPRHVSQEHVYRFHVTV